MTIETRGLTVRYGTRQIIAGLDLRIVAGEVTAIVGPNGSGKTTLLRAIAGVVRHGGSVTSEGGATPARDTIGYMPQDNAARAMLTVFEVVLLGRLRSLSFRVGDDDLAAVSAALSELGIEAFAQRRIGELSGGQRQLVFLAQVLAANPRVLLLDEPTSALDVAHQFQVLDLLRGVTRRRGLTTMVVLHDLNAAARYADTLVLLNDGRAVRTGPPGIVLRADLLSAIFGVEIAIVAGPDGQPVVVPVGMRATLSEDSRTAARCPSGCR